jgi:hypothetical protein
MSAHHTSEAIAAMTDEGLFERLATAVLRTANPAYESLVHPGVNAAGKTVKSPLDGITYVSGASPPHLVAAHHTTTALEGLERKWLHDPSKVKRRVSSRHSGLPGDLIKSAQIIAEERARTPNLVATLVLTTNQEPGDALVRTVEAEARSRGIRLDLWSRSRLAHFLDNVPSGQWLRYSLLGIAQEQLSAELLRALSLKSLSVSHPLDDSAAWIVRRMDSDLAPIQLRNVTFLVAPSGFGKTVACYRALAAHGSAGGFGFVLPADSVADALTLEQALSTTLQHLHPTLSPASPSPLSFCSSSNPLFVVVEDINRSGQASRLIERLAHWGRSAASDAQSVSSGWKLVCPVWPEVLASLPDQTRKALDSLLVFAESFSPSEGQDAVLARARLAGRALSPVAAAAISSALGHDPLLIALHEEQATDPLRIIGQFIDNALSRTSARTPAHTVPDLRYTLRMLALKMLAYRELAPRWRDVIRWLDPAEVDVQLLALIAHDGGLLRLDGASHSERLSFRHDRVRDWLLADALDYAEQQSALPDDIVAEPFFADVVGTALTLSCIRSELLARVRGLNPLALFCALRLYGRAHQQVPDALSAALHGWLEDPLTHTPSNRQLRLSTIAILADTDSLVVPALTRMIRERTWDDQLARLRNGDFSGGVELCAQLEPGVQAPWRDAQLEHATLRHLRTLSSDLERFLRRTDLSTALIQGALRLSGHLADPCLAPAIQDCWMKDTERSQSIADYLWAFAQCCGQESAKFLGPVCDAWLALPDDGDDEHVSARFSVAKYHLRWAFRSFPPHSAIPYFISRAAEEGLRWPLTHMLLGLDNPTAVQFVVRELAGMRRRLEGSDSFSPYLMMASDEWRRAQDNGRPMSPASRDALAAMWRSDEHDKHIQCQAFDLWSATNGPEDLALLRAAQLPDELGASLLKARLLRGDATAIPALIEKLSHDTRGHWWQYARRVWSPALSSTLDEWLSKRGASRTFAWGDHVEADWLTHEMIQRLPGHHAELLLAKHWDHLRYAPHFVQAALYVGTPRLVQLADDAIRECPTPGILFQFLSHRYGIRIKGHPGVTRETQIRVLAPYLHLLAAIDRAALWDECNDHGWYTLRKELLDGIQPPELHHRPWGRDHAFGVFDKMASDENRFALLGHTIDDFAKLGAAWEDVFGALTEWLIARQTPNALSVVAAALVLRGRRRDLTVLATYNGARSSEIEAIIANTEFAVRRHTLH